MRATPACCRHSLIQPSTPRWHRPVCVAVSAIGVNPAYTSIIGRVKFADRYGLSVQRGRIGHHRPADDELSRDCPAQTMAPSRFRRMALSMSPSTYP